MKTNLEQSDLKRFRQLFEITRKEISIIFGFGINVWGEYERSIDIMNNMSKSNETLIKLMLDPDSYNYYLKSMNEHQIEKIGKYRYKRLVSISDDVCNQMKEKISEYRQVLINKLYEDFKNTTK